MRAHSGRRSARVGSFLLGRHGWVFRVTPSAVRQVEKVRACGITLVWGVFKDQQTS